MPSCSAFNRFFPLEWLPECEGSFLFPTISPILLSLLPFLSFPLSLPSSLNVFLHPYPKSFPSFLSPSCSPTANSVTVPWCCVEVRGGSQGIHMWLRGRTLPQMHKIMGPIQGQLLPHQNESTSHFCIPFQRKEWACLKLSLQGNASKVSVLLTSFSELFHNVKIWTYDIWYV